MTMRLAACVPAALILLLAGCISSGERYAGAKHAPPAPAPAPPAPGASGSPASAGPAPGVPVTPAAPPPPGRSSAPPPSAAGSSIPLTPSRAAVEERERTGVDRIGMLTAMMPLMGVPYCAAGSDSGGFDCSGFTASVFAKTASKELPHSAAQQYRLGRGVGRGKLRFGDLVFFAIGRRKVPTHVGVYVGDGLFAHASLSIGVTISLLDNPYYKKRYLGARRILP